MPIPGMGIWGSGKDEVQRPEEAEMSTETALTLAAAVGAVLLLLSVLFL